MAVGIREEEMTAYCITSLDWRLVVDFFKSAIGSLAWPGLIGMFLMLFRSQIAYLLKQLRITKVEAWGANLEFSNAPILKKEINASNINLNKYNELVLNYNRLYCELLVTRGILLETWKRNQQTPPNFQTLVESVKAGAKHLKQNSPDIYYDSLLSDLETLLKQAPQ